MISIDEKGTKIKTKYKNIFPKGTVCQIITCKFVGSTTVRAYLIESSIGEVAWYLDRDLENA